MKRCLYKCAWVWLFIAGCTFANENPVTLTVTADIPPSATLTATLQPSPTLPPTPYQIVLPSTTMSPQESENALLELLKTNGNCTDKCIAGIRPDDMTVQEAVNIMAQWGMVRIGENSQGKTFINLDQSPLYGQVSVYLSVGTWTKRLETIDNVAIRIEGSSDRFLGDDVWRTYREALRGFNLDSILKAYGIPSYVGYDFSSNFNPTSPLEERSFSYGISMHYEQLNLEVFIAALAYYDGQNLFLCPSKDPHYLWMEINPERPLQELQGFYPVTWQELTGTDLNAFYQVITNRTNPDACIKTTVEQILTLHPSYR